MIVTIDGRRYTLADPPGGINPKLWVQQCLTRGDSGWYPLADGGEVHINWRQAATIEVES